MNCASHQRSKAPPVSGMSSLVAGIVAAGLLTGCQTFNYTDADLERERAQEAARLAGRDPFGFGPGYGPPPDFGPLHLDAGPLCVPQGSLGGFCLPSTGQIGGIGR